MLENILINLHERMLPTSAGVEPATSWSPVGRDPTEPPRPAHGVIGMLCSVIVVLPRHLQYYFTAPLMKIICLGGKCSRAGVSFV